MSTITKPKFDRVRAAAVQKTATQFGVGDNWVRYIIRKKIAGDILSYFDSTYEELEKVMNP